MKNIVITAQFRDKDNFDRIYSVGEVVSVSEDRAQYLAGLGLAKIEPSECSEFKGKAEEKQGDNALKLEMSENGTKKRKSSV